MVGSSSVAIASGSSIADRELDALNNNLGNYNNATLTIARSGGANTSDIFSFGTMADVTVNNNTLLYGNNVIANFTNTGGQLQITFVSTNGSIANTALVHEVIDAIYYSSSSNSLPSSIALTYTFNDGLGIGSNSVVTGTAMVNIDYPPTISNSAATAVFVEGLLPVTVSAGISISDPHNLDLLNSGLGNYGGTTLTIARSGGANSQDLFSFGTMSGITINNSIDTITAGGHVIANFTNTAGQLQINFVSANGTIVTKTIINEIADAVQYSNSNGIPPGSINLAYSLNDGLGYGVNSISTINAPVNIYYPPVVNTNASVAASFIVGASSVAIASGSSIADRGLDSLNNNLGDYNSSILTVARSGGANVNDVFSFGAMADVTVNNNTLLSGGNVIANFTNLGGQLQIAFVSNNGSIATTALVHEIVDSIYYQNTANSPPANVTLAYTFNDGLGFGSNSIAASLATVDIYSPPTINNYYAAATFIEGSAPVSISTGVSISDPHELDGLNSGLGNYGGTTLTVARSGGANAQDQFSFSFGNTSGISVNGPGETITFNGHLIANFTNAAGQLQINFVSASGAIVTTAIINEVVDAIQYSNTSNLPYGSINLAYSLNDGLGNGANSIATTDVAVNVVSGSLYYPPDIENSSASATFVEGITPVVISTGISIVDPNILDLLDNGLGNYNGTTLTILRSGGSVSDDVFSFNAMANITVNTINGTISYNNSVIANFINNNGQLQIHFTSSNGAVVTTALVNEIANGVCYSNSNSTPPDSVTLDYMFDDGMGFGSVTTNATINIEYFPPIVNNSASTAATFIAGLEPVAISTGISISASQELDILNSHLGNYNGASLTVVRAGSANAQDLFSFGTMADVTVNTTNGTLSAGGHVIANYTNTAGQLQINFVSTNGSIATTSLVNEVANAIQYSNSSSLPPNTVVLSYEFSDGIGVNTVMTNAVVDIMTSYTYHPPVISNSIATATFIEGGTPVVESGVAISDPNLLDLFNNNLGNYNGTTLTVARSGGANAEDLLSFGAIAGGVSVNNNGTLTINGNVIANFTNTAGQLQINFVSAGGTIVTKSLVNTIVDAIQYSNSYTAAPGNITLDYTFNDGISTNSVTTSAIVDIYYKPSIVNNGAKVSYIEGLAPVAINAGIVISDPHELDALNNGFGDYNGSILTIARSGAPNSQDVFSFGTISGVTVNSNNLVVNGNTVATFTNSGGTLQIHFVSANGTVATTSIVNAIVDAIQYSNSSSSPPSSVTLSCQFNDGIGASSVAVNQSVNILYYAPTISNSSSSATYIEGITPVNIALGVTIADPHELGSLNSGLGNYSGSSLTVARAGSANSQDVFSFGNMADVTVNSSNGTLLAGGNVIANFTNVNGKLQISFVSNSGSISTTALVNEITDAIQYSNSSHTPPSSVTLSYKFSDGIGANSVTTNATVKIVYYSPTVSNTSVTATFVEGMASVAIAAGMVISDSHELDTLNSGLGNYNGAMLTIARAGIANSQDVFSFGAMAGVTVNNNTLVDVHNNIIANFTNATGTLQINFTSNHGSIATTSLVNQVVDAIQYSTAGYVPSGSVNLAYTFNDGIGVNSVTTNAVINIYEPPILGLTTVGYTEGSTATSIASNIFISDAALQALNNGSGDFSGSYLTISRTGGINAHDSFGFGTIAGGITISGNNLLDSNHKVIATIDSATNPGQLKITFSDVAGNAVTQTMVDDVVRAVTYSTTDTTIANGGSANLTYVFNDGISGVSSSTATANVTVNYNAPIANVTSAAATYTEAGTAATIATGVVISDAALQALNNSSGDYSGSYITISRNGGINAHDTFGFGTISGGITQSGNNLLDSNHNIIASINNTANPGQLKITFSDTAGDAVTQTMVDNIVKAITYSTTDATIANNGTANLTYAFNDGVGGVSSAIAAANVTVNYNAPTANVTSAAASYTEGGTAATVAASVAVSDAALQVLNNNAGDYSGSYITISRTGGINAHDSFGFGTISGGITLISNNLLDSNHNIIATINNTANPGQLKITFSDLAGDAVTQTMVNNIIQAITYSTTDTTIANGGSANLTYAFNDGVGGVGSVTATANVTVNYSVPTVVAAVGSANYTEGGAFASIATNVNVSDAALQALNNSSGDYSGSYLTISRTGGINAHDSFGFGTIGSGITQLGNNLLDANHNIIATINNTANPGQLKITFSDLAGDAVTQTMVDNIVKAITYSTTDTTIANGGSANLTYVFNDGIGGIGSATATANVTVNYNAPTATVTSAFASYTGVEPVIVAAGAAINDVALQALNSGLGDYNGSYITISRSGGINTHDSFGFGTINGGITLVSNNLLDNNHNIIATIDSTTNPGQLKITFSDTAGDAVTQTMVDNIAKAITYSTTDTTVVNGGFIELTYAFNNGVSGVNSVTANAIVNYSAPTAVVTSANATYTEGVSATAIATSIVISDTALQSFNNGSGDFSGAYLTISRTSGINAHDVFGFGTIAGGITQVGNNLLDSNSNIIASINNTANPGQLKIAFTDYYGDTVTQTMVDNIVKAITYSTTDTTVANNGTVNLTYELNDGIVGVSSIIGTANVTINYNAPVASVTSAAATYTEAGTAAAVLSSVTISDAALQALNNSSGDFSGSYITISRTGGINAHDSFGFGTIAGGITQVGNNLLDSNHNIIATINNTANPGQLKITFSDLAGDAVTQTMVDNIIQAITYSTTDTTIANGGSANLTYVFNDGVSGVGSSTATANVTVNYNAPTANVTSAAATYTEAGTAATVASGVVISDAALQALDNGLGDYSGSYITISRTGGINLHDLFSVGTIAGGITRVGNNLFDSNNDLIATLDKTTNHGQLKITFSDTAGDAVTQTMVNNIVNAITYSTTDTTIANGSLLGLTYSFNDGVSGVGSVTTTANVTVNYSAPTATVTSAAATYTEGGTAATVAINAVISDAALQALNHGSGDYSGSSLTIARTSEINAHDSFGFGTIDGGITLVGNNLLDSNSNIIASINNTANPGQLKIMFSDTAGDAVTQTMVDNIVKAITYSTTDTTIVNGGSVGLTYSFNDGISGVSSATVVADVNINYNAPVADITSAFANYTGTAVDIATNVVISDAALQALDNGSGDYNGSYITISRAGGINANDSFGFSTIAGGITRVGSSLFDGNTDLIATIDRTTNPGQIKITFSDTAGDAVTQTMVDNILQAITYRTTDLTVINGGFVDLTYAFNDGVSGVGSVIANTIVNYNAPTATITSADTTYTEGNAAVVVAASVVVTDAELQELNNGSGDYSGSSLTIARTGGINANDSFGFGTIDGGITLVGNNLLDSNENIIASINNTANPGQLKITFSDTAGDAVTQTMVDNIVKAITYSTTDLTVADSGSLSLTYVFNDGISAVSSAIATANVDIYNPPVINDLDTTSANTYVTGSNTPIVIDNHITISDVVDDAKNSGLGDYNNAQLTIARVSGAVSDDIFNFAAMPDVTVSGNTLIANGNVIGEFNDTNGQLQINFNSTHGTVATTNLVNEVVQAIEYQNTNLNQSSSIDLAYMFNDGNGAASYNSVIADTVININSASLTATAMDVAATSTPIVVDSNITIASVVNDAHNSGSGDYNGAGVTITRTGGANSDDVFTFASMTDVEVAGNTLTTTSGSVIANFISANGQLEINFTSNHGATASTNLVDEIMQAVQYQNGNANPPGSVNLSYTFNDSSNVVGDDWINTLLVNSKVVASSANNNIVDAGVAPVNTVNELVGNGQGDQFIFRPGYNNAEIINFDNTHDQIDLTAFGLSGINDPNLHITTIGNHTNITVTGGGVSISLENDINQLHNNNFIF